MLLSEFENHTGIHPDANLYRVIEHEYNTGDWTDKAGFCHDYKFNVDGLASRLQAAANQRLIDTEEEHSRELHELKLHVQQLSREVAELHAENARLEDDNETQRRTLQQMQVDERRCKMFRVLERYVREDVEPDTIGCNVYAFVDLIKEEETP